MKELVCTFHLVIPNRSKKFKSMVLVKTRNQERDNERKFTNDFSPTIERWEELL